jgi:hypothetical protein
VNIDSYPEARALLEAGADRETLEALCQRVAREAREQGSEEAVAADAWRNEPRA